MSDGTRDGSPASVDVAVIGGGIGGLAAAIALRRVGVDAHVYESAPSLRAAGAGLLLSPNAMQLLGRLGVADAVAAAGVRVEGGELHDARSGLLQRVDFSDAVSRYGAPTVAIHRQRLHAILAAALPPDRLHLAAACVGVETADGRARIRFADGGLVDAGLAVGADGLRSTTRTHVAPAARLRYSGQTSWRGVADFAPPAGGAVASREIWDAGRRFGYAPVAPGETYWFATLDAPAGETDPPLGAPARLARTFAAFPAPVGALVAATDAERVVRTDIHDVEPFRGWSRGRVVLLGDAAHATTPNLGQGAAQAIEDAWVLADRVAALGVGDAALRAYEAVREPRARHVILRSRQLGRVAHAAHPLARALRNAALRWTPASAARREMDRTYRIPF
jgi:2-polyprenyl-6-methoxyphenol hydroxylase-like FAD-dependent oxidoreductase